MIQARKLYAKESFAGDLDTAAYALNSITIDLSACGKSRGWRAYENALKTSKGHGDG
jgi:hypothetical protein